MDEDEGEGEGASTMPPAEVLPALDGHEQWIESDLRFLGLPDQPDWASLGLGDEFTGVALSSEAAAAGGSSSQGAGSS